MVLLLTTSLLFTAYAVLILYYWRSWLSIPVFRPEITNYKPQTRISVIIPARNEQAYIGNCLDSILAQLYPAELFEVIVVDDHSTDDTTAVVKSYEAKNLKLIPLKDHVPAGINSYKKKAIEVAIQHASGELIVTTDADCHVNEHWLQTIAAFYEEHEPAFIAAPVSIDCSNKFIEIFQALDFMTLQGITGASVYKKIHSMCNGANLAYSKQAFMDVNGFAGIDNIASGDDMLLMHKIYKRWPDKVLFLKSTEAIVYTAPASSVKAFLNQRIRWASKADKYDDKRIFLVLLMVYLLNLVLLVLPLIGLFTNIKLSVINYQLSIGQLWLSLLAIKTIVELIFLYSVSKFFGKQNMLWVFPFLQPFHIVYTVIAGWLGKFGSYSWKERKVK